MEGLVTANLNDPSPMIDVRIHDVSFRVIDAHPGFWERVNSGAWEPETFELFDRHLSPETTMLDIGGWIGPTALYAANRAKQVFAFEPDPTAFAVLRANRDANPRLAGLEVIHAAVSTHDGEIRIAPREAPGDSGSSILFADINDAWTVPARRLDTFLAERRIEGPLFLKVDVEGYEYELLPALVTQLRGYRYTAVVSLHPSLLWESSRKLDPRNSFAAKVKRRWRYITSHWRLVRSAKRAGTMTDSSGGSLTMLPILWAITRGRRIVANDTLLLGS
jgi:FkbM family methyltransferase